MHKYSHATLVRLADEVIAQVRGMMIIKGGEYSTDFDALSNFKTVGESLGVPAEVVWSVYASKHWIAIMNYIKDFSGDVERNRSEPIEGRINDLIVYLILLQAIIENRRGE